jgi:hypothetical protein
MFLVHQRGDRAAACGVVEEDADKIVVIRRTPWPAEPPEGSPVHERDVRDVGLDECANARWEA